MRKFLLIVMLTFTLAACSTTNIATPNGPNQATLNVKATDQGYDSSTYEVPAGAEITVNFTNDAPQPHVFAVLKKGEHVTPPFQTKDEAKIMWKITAQTGETRSDIFKAPTVPGDYDIICPFPGHIEYGMKATLVVKAK
jgi:plastocyanin